MEQKIQEAVARTLKTIDEETDPSKMSQQDTQDFYDALWDAIEERYGKICEDLGR